MHVIYKKTIWPKESLYRALVDASKGNREPLMRLVRQGHPLAKEYAK